MFVAQRPPIHKSEKPPQALLPITETQSNCNSSSLSS